MVDFYQARFGGGLNQYQAAEGDTIAVRTFLLAGMNIDARDGSQFTALLKAADMGQTETVQALLAAGADVNYWGGTEPHRTALTAAAVRGDLPTMKILLSGGACVDCGGYEPPLMTASARGPSEAVILLLDSKARLEFKNYKGELVTTALIKASCNNRMVAARILLDTGAEVNSSITSTGQTALHCAAQKANPELIKLLLDRGADVRVPLAVSGKMRSPLVQVLENNAAKTPEKSASALLLIERGADINAATPFQESPLLLAVRWQLPEVVRALLNKGADPNKGRDLSSETGLTPGSGNRPLITALEAPRFRPEGNVEIALLLIERGADVNASGWTSAVGSIETTPLLLAIQAKRADVVRALLAKGANPNQAVGGRTPLRAAAENPEITQLLIAAGAKQ